MPTVKDPLSSIDCARSNNFLKNEPPIIQSLSLNMLISNNSFEEKKLLQAMKDGVFYLEIPKELSSSLNSAKSFANSFYKSDFLKNNQLTKVQEYRNPNSVQIETYVVEKNSWGILQNANIFSDELVFLANKMHEIGLLVIKRVLETANILSSQWDSFHINVNDYKGLSHLIFNHYRSERICEGIPTHQDDGYITVLYTDKNGLEGKINGVWTEIFSKNGLFYYYFWENT